MNIYINQIIRQKSSLSAVIILLFFLITGCASNDWSEPLSLLEAEGGKNAYTTTGNRLSKCSKGLELDLTAVVNTITKDYSFNGILEIKHPSAIRLSSLNPLGHPIYVAIKDKNNFQLINILRKEYMHGKIDKVSLLANFPALLLNGNWANWLTGRLDINEKYLNTHQNKENHLIWVSTINRKKDINYFLLIDPTNHSIIKRVILDATDEIIAEILYQYDYTDKECNQPSSVIISKLPYKTQIELLMSKVVNRNFIDKDFTLKIPPYYKEIY